MGDVIEWFKGMTPGGVGIWACVGLIAVALIRQRPIMERLKNERESDLLGERASDMRGMRRRIRQLEGEQRVDRHTIGNLEQCLDTLLMMIDVNPDRAKEAAGKVLKMRQEQKADRAMEKAALLKRANMSDAEEEAAVEADDIAAAAVEG